MRWLLLLLAACGGISPGDFSTEVADATCEYYVRCGVFANVSDCRARYELPDDPNIEAAIDAGQLIYDGDAAKACIDEVSSLSCDITAIASDDLASCNAVFTGALAQGESCGFSQLCESENCVKPPSCTMACCTGTCGPPRALPSAGQPCTAVCDDEAFCGSDSICHARLPAGAACDTSDSCQLGLRCTDLSPVSAGTCTTLPHLGESCDATARCAELSAVCIGTCVQAGLPGDACTQRSQCSEYYDCDGSRCVPFPTLGMPCTAACSDGSWCNQATMTCDARKANGAMCTYNGECVSHYCDHNVCSDIPLCI